MTRTIFIAAALALAATLPIAPAQAAGVARTFLSAAGSDSNNCANVMTPCRHLATAYAATAPNGEIYVLDPANYGSLTITGPVSIEGHGWASIAPVAGQAAITINANQSDRINIIGVVLDGTRIGGTTGILYNSGGNLNVRDSVIRNFTGNGISFEQSSSTTSQLHVSNTLISDNGNHGIAITPIGSGTTNGVLSHVEMENNAFSGLDLDTGSQTVNFVVTDCQSTDNSEGMTANSTGGTRVTIMVRNSTIAYNFTTGLHATGNGAQIWATRSTLTGNTTGWAADAPGIVSSYIDNNIDDNPAGNTSPPGPPTYAYK